MAANAIATEDAPISNVEIMDLITQHSPDIVLPSGYLCQRNSSAIVQSVDDGSMSATFAIVTRSKTPNRYGNQLQLIPNTNGKGPITQYYKQNPVVLYDHGMSDLTLPVGLSAQDGKLSLAWSEDKGVATCYFTKQSWAEPVYAAVSEGLLKMASIGFDPLLAMRLTQKGPQAVNDASGVQDCTLLGMDFVEWELLEWSITPIGADRGALRQCLDRGKIHDCKLPAYLRQSFDQHAAKLDRPGIGMDFRRLQLAEVVIEGPTAAVAEIEAAIQQAKKDPPKCKDCNDTKQMACANCGGTTCTQCAGTGKVQCQSCKPPEPDIAPDTAMSYPAADEVAQACAAQLMQSQITKVRQSIIQGVSTAISEAVKPVANRVSEVAKEFQRMTGKLD